MGAAVQTSIYILPRITNPGLPHALPVESLYFRNGRVAASSRLGEHFLSAESADGESFLGFVAACRIGLPPRPGEANLPGACAFSDSPDCNTEMLCVPLMSDGVRERRQRRSLPRWVRFMDPRQNLWPGGKLVGLLLEETWRNESAEQGRIE